MDLAQVLEVTRKLTIATQPRQIFEALVPLLLTTPVDRGGLLLSRENTEEPNNLIWQEAVLWRDIVRNLEVPVSLPPKLQQREPFFCTDISADGELDRVTRKWLWERWYTKAVVVIPLQVRERNVGIFWVGSGEVCAFSLEARRLYDLLAHQVALTLESILPPERIRGEQDTLHTSADEFAALSAIAASMNQSLKLNEVLNTAFNQILRVLELDSGALFLNDADEGIKLVVHRNLNFLAMQTSKTQNGDAPVAKFQQPILLLEISQGLEVICLSMRREGARAIVSVPLLARGKLFGMMDVVTYNHRDFTPQDVRLLTAIGSQVAIAVENAQLYEEVVQAREELEAAYERLKLAQHELVRQEQLAVLGQWAGSVGHELRTPLAVIGNAIYYLRMQWGDANEEVLDSLQRIDAELRRANKIITDLLDFPRFRRARRAQTNLAGVVDRAVARVLDTRDVELVQDVSTDLPQAYVDAAQIEEVLCNLISNAVQAMDGQGKLTIAAQPLNGQIEMRVTDTGIGITTKDAPQIFQPLFTTKPKGVGLGLALSKSLVEVNGGSLSFESELGVGTTFFLRVPAYKEMKTGNEKR